MSGNAEGLKDVLAIVKFEEQTLLASLDTSSYETWIKQLSDLADVPVEAQLLLKGQSINDTGIEIKDKDSFAKVLTAVDEARKAKDVVKLVLYPLKTSDGAEKQSSKLDSTKETSQPKSLLLAVQKGAVVPKSLENPHNCQVCGECPKWAAEVKKELLGVIEDKFTILASKIDDKLSEISQSASYADSLSSMRSEMLSVGSRFSGSGKANGFHMVPRMTVLDTTNSNSGSYDEMTRSRLNAADQEFQAALATLRAQNSEILKIRNMNRELGNVEGVQSAPVDNKSNGSASSSVVVVSSPGSSFVLDDAKTVGNGSTGSLEMVNVDQLILPDEVDETGSVVYVETDDEEEDGHDFTFLKSWASSGSAGGSQVATPMNASTVSLGSSVVQSVSVPSSPPSLQVSFHSVDSGLSAQDAVVTATAGTSADDKENVVQRTISQEQVSVLVQKAQNNQDGVSAVTQPSASPARAVPINGSSQLPVDLNAMRSVESQEIFSPNSDMGTKFLSAASTIANAFIQSMETLSKTLGEVEAKTRASMEKRNSQSNSQIEVLMEQVVTTASREDQGPAIPPAEAQNDGNHVGEAAREQVQPAEQAGQRGRGRREPPKADGPMMSREELDWYLEEYGLDHFGNYLWEEHDGALDRHAFNKFIVDYFDGLEEQ